MQNVSDLQFLQLLPKIELHAHLNGSLSEDTLKKLNALQANKDGPCLWKGFSNLDECFQIFAIAHELTKNAVAVKLATLNTIHEFYNDRVIYLELRSTPRSEIDMTKEDYLRAIIEGILEARIKWPAITTNLIVSINRGESTLSAFENINLAIAMAQEFPDVVVGVDLSGNPSLNAFSDFKEALHLAKNRGLKLAVHCAEIKNPEEIMEILAFGVDRIGHGTCIHPKLGGSEDLWNKLITSSVPVEVCLSSNVASRTVKSIEEGQLGYLLESEHPFVLCTDDKGVFQTSLTREYFLAGKTFQLKRDFLWNLCVKSVEFMFASEAVKQKIKKQLDDFGRSSLTGY